MGNIIDKTKYSSWQCDNQLSREACSGRETERSLKKSRENESMKEET
jgi:hypothetical protein